MTLYVLSFVPVIVPASVAIDPPQSVVRVPPTQWRRYGLTDGRFLAHRVGNKRERHGKGETSMEGKTDDIKGRAKEAAGDLTDDEELQREGKVDRAAGSVKEKGEQFVDKAKDRLQRK